jgi:hypothetical protein
VTFVEGAAVSIGKGLFNTVLILVISIYMLLDMQRLRRAVDRRFPPRPGEQPLLLRIEGAFASYVRGQVLLSLIIGASAGIGMYVLGVTGLVPHAENYALIFGGWVALTEVLPYLGPWLGAIPPATALRRSPPGASRSHSLPRHLPGRRPYRGANVMANALVTRSVTRLLGRGCTASPACSSPCRPGRGRAIWEFFHERITLESWESREPELPGEVELEPPRVVSRSD